MKLVKLLKRARELLELAGIAIAEGKPQEALDISWEARECLWELESQLCKYGAKKEQPI